MMQNMYNLPQKYASHTTQVVKSILNMNHFIINCVYHSTKDGAFYLQLVRKWCIFGILDIHSRLESERMVQIGEL